MTRNNLLHLIYPEQGTGTLWDIWKRLFIEESQYMPISLELPKRELLRLQTFIDDINELDQEADFSMERLIAFLYMDLLQDSRKGKLKNRPFSEKLLTLYQEHKAPKLREAWKVVNQYKMIRVEEPVPASHSMTSYPIQLRKKHVLRGEVLLMDLYGDEKEKIGIKVSDLIALLLIEFADEIRKGPTQKRIQSIMKAIQ
ncbi:hypothetical protein ACFVS2_21005 [Brevibacillus sp. NPDC058079]|uniref:hypothetical protein n=1 Tax=Brevibacillus sp. NPDC058079 TaxID=3346330 RepID=UPI0036EECC7B